MADRIGQQLGNYQLLRKLGEGGFAEVYLGQHIHIHLQCRISKLVSLGSKLVSPVTLTSARFWNFSCRWLSCFPRKP